MTSRRPRALLAAASAAVLLAAADTYVVVLALTDMMAGVGLGIESLQRGTPIVSGFLLGYVAVLPFVGRLADLMDRRQVLLGCLAVFVLGSVTTALAVDLPVLVAGRFVQGVGGGGLVPATLALVADLWPAHRRGLPLGVVGAVQEIGAVLGPVLGAAVLAVSDWRAIFWLGALVGAVLWVGVRAVPGWGPAPGAEPPPARRWPTPVLAGTALSLGILALWAPPRLATDVVWGAPFVPLTGQSRLVAPIALVAAAAAAATLAVTAPRWRPVVRRADLPGAVLVAIALGSVIVTFAGSDPEQEVVGPLGFLALPVGVAALVAALWRHRRVAEPLIPRGVLAGRTALACLVSLLAGAALVTVVVDVPLLARLTLTASQTEAAFVLARFLVAVPLGALAGGWLVSRVGAGPVAAAGLVLAAAGLLVMTGWTQASLSDTAATSTTLALVGLGMGASLAPVNAAALERQTAATHGSASALVVVSRMTGMVVGLALLTSVGLHRYYEAVAALPNPQDPAALLDAAVVQVQTVFGGGALAAAAAGIASLWLGRDAAGWGRPGRSRDQSASSTTTGA